MNIWHFHLTFKKSCLWFCFQQDFRFSISWPCQEVGSSDHVFTVIVLIQNLNVKSIFLQLLSGHSSSKRKRFYRHDFYHNSWLICNRVIFCLVPRFSNLFWQMSLKIFQNMCAINFQPTFTFLSLKWDYYCCNIHTNLNVLQDAFTMLKQTCKTWMLFRVYSKQLKAARVTSG